MDIGEVEEEAEGSDDQIDELSGTRKPRRNERSTHHRGPGKQLWKVPPSGRYENREADNGQENAKNHLRRQGTPSETLPDSSRSRHPSCWRGRRHG